MHFTSFCTAGPSVSESFFPAKTLFAIGSRNFSLSKCLNSMFHLSLSPLYVSSLSLSLSLSVSSLSLYLQWRHFLQLGRGVSEEVLKKRTDMLAPNKCCSIIYTVCPYFRLYLTYSDCSPSLSPYLPQSGTTGKPKGVMLSHDNVS